MKQYDLIVVGGGFAGVCAAIAAARGGMKVLIAEKSNCLGGAAANCLVMPFMPYATSKDGKKRILSRGIFEEITKDISRTEHPIFKDQSVYFDEEILKLELNRKCIDAGVDLLYHAYLCDAKKEDGRITSVTFATVGGTVTLTAPYFIDATGDATLSALLGVSFRVGRREDGLCQPMTLCFRMGGVNIQEAIEHRKETSQLYQKAQAEGKIKNPRENILVFKTLHPDVMHFNSTRVVKLDPTDPFAVTRAEIEAREQVFELVEFVKQNGKGYENAYLLSTAMEIGVRESRMIDGEYMLTEEDLKACTVFEDAIATGNYDIDIHNPAGSGTSHYYFAPGDYYTIPYRSLIPKGMKNLLVAGRCISATHEAQASIRIMPIVATIGEAAGHAIAQCMKAGKDDVRNVDMNALHDLFDQNNISYK